jgi:polar amino acid transport system substrate-binding protein
MLLSKSQKIIAWIWRFRVALILALGVLALLFIAPQISAETAIATRSPKAAESVIVPFAENDYVWEQLGDRSEDVQTLQTNLKALGYEGVDSASGFFDEATDRAVREFQRSEGLDVDGIVGPITQAKIAAVGGKAGIRIQGNLEGNLEATQAQATASNAPAHAALPPDIQRIVDRGKLVVSLLNKDNPPFFMVGKGGQLEGSDVKMAQAIAAELDVDLEFRRTATTFDEVVDDVYEHRADLAISKVSRTLKRAKRTRFSAPYLSLRQGLLVNRLQLAQNAHGSSMTEMIRNLEGKIGVIEGSSYAGFAEQKFPKATVVSYPNWDEVVKAVTNGEVLAAYRDELEVKKIVLSSPDVALQFQTIALTDTQDALSMALPWNSSHLLAFVNQYLDTAALTDTTDGLLEEYADYFQGS